MFYTRDLTFTSVIQLATCSTLVFLPLGDSARQLQCGPSRPLRVVLNTLDNMKVGIDSPRKGIMLRVDVHLCTESHIFVLYPADANGFVAYFVRHRYSDCPKLFHWRRTTIHLDVPLTFPLYDPARFDNSGYPV